MPGSMQLYQHPVQHSKLAALLDQIYTIHDEFRWIAEGRMIADLQTKLRIRFALSSVL